MKYNQDNTSKFADEFELSVISEAYNISDDFLIMFIVNELTNEEIEAKICYLKSNNYFFNERLTDLKDYLITNDISSYKEYLINIASSKESLSSDFKKFIEDEIEIENSSCINDRINKVHDLYYRNENQSLIKIIGIGDGGNNVLNSIYSMGVKDIDFVVCNTDPHTLNLSPIPNKILFRPNTSSFEFASVANPDIGAAVSEEIVENIEKILKRNTRIVFIVAGMGGGIGTSGALTIAKICRKLGILTVGIVSTPFSYEGRKRKKHAREGIEYMQNYIDTFFVISNDKLRKQFGNLSFTKAFEKADDILATTTKCIIDFISSTRENNLNFPDIFEVLKDRGFAILGHGSVCGENRALQAVKEAINSPILTCNTISKSKCILLNITSSEGEFEHTIDEISLIQDSIQKHARGNCDVVVRMGHDSHLKDKISVTIIATGFKQNEIFSDAKNLDSEIKKIKTFINDSNDTSFLLSHWRDISINHQIAKMYLRVARYPFIYPRSMDTIRVFMQNAENLEDYDLIKEFNELTAEEYFTNEDDDEKRKFEEKKKLFEERVKQFWKVTFDVKKCIGNTNFIEKTTSMTWGMTEVDNNCISNMPDCCFPNYDANRKDEQNNSNESLHLINTP